MSVNSVQQFLNVRDSHLRVVSGNVHADQMVLGGVTVDTSHGLQSVTNTSNVTTNTVEFSNTTTAFVTTANVEVGGELTVSGNATVTANAEIGGDLTVSGNTFYSNNTSIHVDSNVVAEFTGPHGRLPKVVPLKKYPEIAFISNEGVGGTYDRNLSSTTPFEGTFIQAGYTASSSSNYGSSVGQGAWNLFAHRNSEPNDNYSWYSQNATNYNGTVGGNYSYSGNKNIGTGAVDGEWVKIEMPEKIRLKSYILWGADLESEFPQGWTLYGSDNGTSWSSIHSKDGQTIGSGSWSTTSNSATGKFVNLDVTSSDYYKYFALVFTRAGARNDYIGIGEWELYGYEEDPPAGDTSVDTTFTSIMNTPQTTGANVYVDAKLSSDFTNQVTGPTPVGPAATHNDTGKYWELTGALTSNVTLEANTFLEGDQPHAVSVWFNSSNLEANVSNTCVFSVSDQEHLNSQNLDLQSNTWHNLTYAYQGEGGSRVTYLDGRKVAEDQTEDTFGDYPPFAMTGYSQGGYVVSASGEYNTTQYNAWKAFDGDTTTSDNSFITLNDSYVAATGATKGNYLFGVSITDNTGTVHSGEWIKMEFPHKLVINSVKMDKRPYASPNLERMLPAEFAILGSNDDQTWYLIHNRTGIATNAPTGTHFVSTGNYKTKGFKYVVIVLKKASSNAASNEDHIAIGEITFYGHRENDLVRLPDPTNVLKYPHIAMTGPAQRGYVASASSEYSTGIYPPHQAFNEEITLSGIEPNNHVWTSDTADYPASGGTYTSTTYGIGTTYGEFIKLELPHKLKATKARIYPRTYTSGIGNNQSPAQFKIFGSNDNFSSEIVELYNQNTDWVNNGTWGEFTISTTSYFKHFGIVFTKTNGANIVGIQALEYYGTEEATPVPIQIGGGNIDKVANFRVYDKFVGEDQALEIWDAQKDEFGRAKSSMTLYKGRLGIGTTEPQGRLAVLDEPHNLEEFPPRAMTADKTYIEGHGEFCASVTEIYPNAYAYKAFNKIQSGSGLDFHWSTNTADYDNVTGVYTGSSDYFTNVEGQIALGHWIQIDFPYKINYRYSEIQGPDHTAGRQPHTGYIVGSNDLSGVWTSLHNYSGMTRTGDRDFVTYTPPTISTQSFKYFRLVIEKMGGNTTAGVSQWHIFGTREQGQSVLHDGQLTLTKNLTVPRMGPALDADDTPRRDRLVVEYNTSTNPTFEGAVRDTSGRGNDGVFYGTNMNYSSTEKALVFNGTNDYIEHDANFIDGINAHTMSIWVNPDAVGNNWRGLIKMGDNSAGNSSGLYFAGTAVGTAYNGKITFTSYGNNLYSSTIPTVGNWIHICGTYDGTTRRLYLDGVQIATDTATINLTGTSREFIIGAASPTSEYFDGSISNFKLYDTALTAEEVKTLYNMGRCDEGGHVVNFSKTRVGIGLGDGEVPRAVLDVRGDIRYINIAPIALPTFYDHILAGRSDRGIYPIVGTQGGTKIYNVYCEPDMYGGGWMCFAQVPQVGSPPAAWNLYTDEFGNANVFLSPQNSTTRRHAMFSAPMNILSNNNGVNLDVLLMVYGNGLRNNGTFGAKVGAIWRGVNLNHAFNSNSSGSTGTDSNQARSSNGVDFTASSKALSKGNAGWDFSISVNGEGVDGGYGDSNDGTAGYIVHGVSNGWNIYCDAIVGPGGSWQYVNNPNWEYVRFFVRPSSF